MEPSSLSDSGVLVDAPPSDNPNDMTSSGILVEKPGAVDETTTTPIATNNRQRRHNNNNVDLHPHLDDNDYELSESIMEDSRQKRLQQLAADQKSKRSTKQQQGRTNPSPNSTQANPFSRFLTAFSVDPQYPHHKRAHEDEQEEEEPPLKHARTLNGDDENNDPITTHPAMNLLSEITDTLMENSSTVMAIGAAVASLALMTLIRKKA